MEILQQFGINPILLAAQVVNFFILLFLLKKFLYGPILKVLNERKKRIEDSLKNAEEIEKRLQETNEKIDQMMAKASGEIQVMMSEGQKMRDQILYEAHQKASKIVENMMKKGEEALRVEKEKMLGEVRGEITRLVVAVFHKLTGKVITQKDQKEMIEREVKNLS